MQSSGQRVLRIISHIKRPSYNCVFFSAFLRVAVLLALPLYLIFYVNGIVSYKLLVGDYTLKITHEYVNWEKKPKIAYSVWREQDPFINGSSYERSHFNEPHFLLFCCTFYNWNQTFSLIKDITIHTVNLVYVSVKALTKRFGWKRLILFLSISCVLNLILFCGWLSFLQLMSDLIKKSVITWFDSQVSEFTFPKIILAEAIPHPLTSGKERPFYLTTFYRYNKEDVVFNCEYNVTSLKVKGAFPIFRYVNWRKNGAPVIFNDRIYANLSILSFNRSGLFDVYSFKSTLTIEMIEEDDFGGYACVFYNPMPIHIVVQPGPSMLGDFIHILLKSNNEFYDSKSQCNSCENLKESEDFDSDKQNESSEDPDDNLEIFSEFRLEKVKGQTTSLGLNPGSIFITRAHYVTTTDIEDLEYDVSFPTDHQNGRSCCSKLVWLYWVFFREGSYQNPPFTRILIDGHTKYFIRYQCVCPSAYGTKDFAFTRKYFNHTTRSYDKTDIVFPMKPRLLPTLSHPWSSSNGSKILNPDAASLSCWDSDSTSESHVKNGCEVQNVLEFILENFIFYEKWIFNIFSAMLATSFVFVSLRLHRCSIRPILAACLTYGIRETTLSAVKGPLITYPDTCTGDKADTPQNRFGYQFYISYQENNEFDLMVAQQIKGLFLTLNLSVFDYDTDVLPGMPMLESIRRAIDTSYRFVVIASKDFLEDQMKMLEFDCIQQAIICQESKLEDRMIIIQTEDFEIQGIYRVPHILIQEEYRIADAMDELSLTNLLDWEKATRSKSTPIKPDPFYSNIWMIMNRKLVVAICIVLSFLLITCIGLW